MSYILNSKQIFTPTTGSTVAVANADGDIRVLLNPAGTLATLTLAFPSIPKDGQKLEISTSQILTVLTMTSFSTILSALTTLGINGFAGWVYDSSTAKWFRIT